MELTKEQDNLIKSYKQSLGRRIKQYPDIEPLTEYFSGLFEDNITKDIIQNTLNLLTYKINSVTLVQMFPEYTEIMLHVLIINCDDNLSKLNIDDYISEIIRVNSYQLFNHRTFLNKKETDEEYFQKYVNVLKKYFPNNKHNNFFYLSYVMRKNYRWIIDAYRNGYKFDEYNVSRLMFDNHNSDELYRYVDLNYINQIEDTTYDNNISHKILISTLLDYMRDNLLKLDNDHIFVQIKEFIERYQIKTNLIIEYLINAIKLDFNNQDKSNDNKCYHKIFQLIDDMKYKIPNNNMIKIISELNCDCDKYMHNFRTICLKFISYGLTLTFNDLIKIMSNEKWLSCYKSKILMHVDNSKCASNEKLPILNKYFNHNIVSKDYIFQILANNNSYCEDLCNKLLKMIQYKYTINDIENMILFGNLDCFHNIGKNDVLQCNRTKIMKYACMKLNVNIVTLLLDNKVTPSIDHIYYVLSNPKSLDDEHRMERIIELLIGYGLDKTMSLIKILKINGFDDLIVKYNWHNVDIDIELKLVGRATGRQYINRKHGLYYFGFSNIQSIFNLEIDDTNGIENILQNHHSGMFEYVHDRFNYIPEKEDIFKLGDKGRKYVLLKRFNLL